MTTPQGDEPDEPEEADEDPGTGEAEAEPLDVAPDDIFAAALGAPDGGTTPGDDATSGRVDGDETGTDGGIDDTAAAGVSVYPDGPRAPDPAPAAAPVWGTPRLPPPGGRAFTRRAPRTGPEPDEHGYYPDDYYLPPDWTRLFARLVVAALVLATLAVAALEISDRFATGDEDDETRAEPTATPAAEVAVYECAGDPDPVALLPPPGPLLIAGRTADSRWLAFRNLEPPPLQLWVEARDVPTFVPSTVGIVSCATAPDEFPTPR